MSLIQPRRKARDLARDPRNARCLDGKIAVARTADPVQVFGGRVLLCGFRAARLCGGARITQIFEGTNQIQHMIIAREFTRRGAAA